MQDFNQVEPSQFAFYQKDMQSRKTRNQKRQQKIQRMKRDMNDPQMKKQRHRIRRGYDKKKLKKDLQDMDHQQARVFLDARKEKKRIAKEKMMQALIDGQQVLVDMVYEKVMNEKENKSLAIQVELIMKTIRHLNNPPGIHLCNVGGLVQQQLKKMTYHYWVLESHKEGVTEVGQMINKKLVYLSPDASKPLQEVNDDTAYVIGGLVDRSVLKNASLNRANQLNIEARYLPIREFMKNRSCLNLDHVVLIISKFKQCKNWKQAFQFGAPKRWKKQQHQFGIRKVQQESDYQSSSENQSNQQNQGGQHDQKNQQNETKKQQKTKQQQNSTLNNNKEETQKHQKSQQKENKEQKQTQVKTKIQSEIQTKSLQKLTETITIK